MARSGKSIEEVRQILGRLDRSITEARRRRLGADEPESAPVPHREPAPEPTFGLPPEPAPVPQPISETRARYGKARPLGRTGEPPSDSAIFGLRRPDQRAS